MLPRLTAIFSVIVLLALWAGEAVAQNAQIDQSRQLRQISATGASVVDAAPPSTLPATLGRDTESFGLQQMLREQEKLRPFRAFAEISAFVTSNVALTRREPLQDSFLLAAFGFEYRRPLANGLQFESGLRLATFRYNEFRQLDFNSGDVGAGLTYHAEKLGGIDLFARYNFNGLMGADSGDTFFKNHTITLGAQKVIPFSQAHHAFFGASAQAGFADPKEAERAEFSAFTGYHLQATRHLDADLFYRFSHFVYTEGDRRDNNHTLSAAVRYRFTEWFSIGASAFAGFNRSNQEVFDYDVANAGGGLTLSLLF